MTRAGEVLVLGHQHWSLMGSLTESWEQVMGKLYWVIEKSQRGEVQEADVRTEGVQPAGPALMDLETVTYTSAYLAQAPTC